VTVFVRHAPAVVDRSSRSATWPITAEAADAVRALRPQLPPIEKLVASDLRRASDTAALLGEPLLDARLREVPRPWTDDLDRDVEQYLAGKTLDGWEPQAEVLTRFSACIAEHGPVTYVSHGTVLSLYLGSVVQDLDAFAFWKALALPDAWELRGHELQRICGNS
jgi:broad specificity phosphatase PhoE